MTLPGRSLRTLVLAGALLAAVHAPLAAQSAGATEYLARYRQLMGLRPAGTVAEVSNLVIARDAGRLTLTRGRLYLLEPLGDRTVAAVFVGEGRFAFTPAMREEQGELRRFADTSRLDEPFTEATLVFTDSTADQLRALASSRGDVPDDVDRRLGELLSSLGRGDDGEMDADLMAQFLNPDTGLFMARIRRVRGDPLLFRINPAEYEAVQLLKPVSRRDWGTNWAVVSSFPARVPVAGATAAWDRRQVLDVQAYVLDIMLNEGVDGTISARASANFTVKVRQPAGPWLVFDLARQLDLDSVRVNGEAAAFFKVDDSEDAWVHVGRRLQRGDSITVVVKYHGSMLDRFENWFFVNTYSSWFPVNRQGARLATFDITFRSPMRYPLASVGTLRDSSTTGRVRTTRWVTDQPTRFASFNLGLYERFAVREPETPPIDVLLSADGHRTMRQQALSAGVVLPEQRNMREAVAEDVANSLRLFTRIFGPPPYSHFTVTEVPYGHGVSFPGLMHLSWGTFMETTMDGFDEFFRAHEVSHQWWGNGVRPESYRDYWLSEGLSTFTGLTYLRFKKQNDNQYNRFLDRYRTDILSYRDQGPIAIGPRATTPERPRGYQIMTYQKGAWVFHMLRSMMLDLRTMSPDAFTAMMRDFYQLHQGRSASTADLQALVEERLGQPMGWFFDQWVRSSGIPSYRVAWRTEQLADGRYLVHFKVRQEQVPATFRMPVLVGVRLGNDRVARFRLTVTGEESELVSPPIPGEPREILFNDLRSVLAEVERVPWGPALR